MQKYGVDISYTPMVLADTFKNSSIARDKEFQTCQEDTPVVAQFASRNAEDFAAAACLVEPFVDAVDLNCGCPQRWAYQERIGSYMMDCDPQLVFDIIRTANRRTNIPVSLKIRVHSEAMRTVQFAQQMEKAGASWIAVHGRTRKEKASDAVNYETIKLIKENVNIPVIANGDIFNLSDVDRIVEQTGVNGVMSARGILRNPALFAGYASTPIQCVQDYIRNAIEYGTNSFIFHHHLIYMMEDMLTKQEQKMFNSLSSVGIAGILDHLQTEYGIIPEVDQ